MRKKLSSEIRRLRDQAGFTQSDISGKLGDIPVSTYSLKERAGNFTHDEIKIIAKTLKVPAKPLLELAEEVQMTVDDSINLVLEKVLGQDAILETLLRATAEILANQRGQKTEVVLSQLIAAANQKSKETIISLSKQFSS